MVPRNSFEYPSLGVFVPVSGCDGAASGSKSRWGLAAFLDALFVRDRADAQRLND